jgi:hypothetical protein
VVMAGRPRPPRLLAVHPGTDVQHDLRSEI